MTCSPTARWSGAFTTTVLRCAAGVAIVLVGHLDLASDPGRDERHSRDARRSDGDVSGGMGISRQRHGHQQTTGWRDNCS
jgi:hypothetical protein